MTITKQTTVAIIGGGLVGATLAIALAPILARHNKKLTLIEAITAENTQQTSFDGRFSALSYGSKRLLDNLELWQLNTPLGGLLQQACAIEQVHVSQRGYFGATHINCQDLRVEALGYVIANQWMGRVFNEKLSQLPLQRIAPAQVIALQPSKYGYQLQLADQRSLEAELVILADGGRSNLKQQLGIQDDVKDYHQTALIAELTTELDHQHIAYECFAKTGPMALLPSGPNRVALVWTLTAKDLTELSALSDADFLAAVNHYFGNRLGHFLQASPRASYPLKMTIARELVRPHLALVGNAAHSLHPVAGQGFNLALRGALDLAQILEKALNHQQDLGDMATLQCYSQLRQPDQNFMVQACDQLVNIFGLSWPFIAPLRSVGLIGLNIVTPLRRAIARRAMGIIRGL